MKPGKASSLLLTLFLSGALALPAPALADAQPCPGPVTCVALFIVGAPIALAISALTPKSSDEQMWDAVGDGDVNRVKRLLRTSNKDTPDSVLSLAGKFYLKGTASAQEDKRLALIQYLLDEHLVDLSGAPGTALLQDTIVYVDHDAAARQAPGLSAQKRLALAKLAIAHGATAEGVKLSWCIDCDMDGELLSLLIQHGADPNAHDFKASRRALLDKLIEQDRFETAAQLIQLGADPNGSGWADQSMLATIVGACNPETIHAMSSGPRADAQLQQCSEKAAVQIRFAVAHGADPNGKTTSARHCITPYDIAKTYQNEALAQTLLELGASPDFGAQCRQTAPARAAN